MLHLDLFSGIGGFAYAIDQVFDDTEHIFCEWDKFCQQVLKKHWPRSLVYGDIKSITSPDDWRPQERELQTARDKQHSGVWLLTGGFPCQPFSAAGVRRGTSDDRYLWPEMLRVIRLTSPQWVIAENVGGLLTWEEGLVFEQVCSDLESAGYEVQAFVIPAVAVNAPHRRDRVWFVAHKLSERLQRGSGIKQRELQKPAPDTGQVKYDSNTNYEGLERLWDENGTSEQTESRGTDFGPADWSRDWMEVATEFCSVDDGLPVELDGFKLSKPASRKEQLKAYGNAIVPQVAIEILRGIKMTVPQQLKEEGDSK